MRFVKVEPAYSNIRVGDFVRCNVPALSPRSERSVISRNCRVVSLHGAGILKVSCGKSLEFPIKMEHITAVKRKAPARVRF